MEITNGGERKDLLMTPKHEVIDQAWWRWCHGTDSLFLTDITHDDKSRMNFKKSTEAFSLPVYGEMHPV